MTRINDYVKNLDANRKKAWEEQKAVLDAAATSGRELTAEEKQTVERTDAEMDRLDGEIKGWLERYDREQEHDTAREAYAGLIERQSEEPRSDEFSNLVGFMRGEHPGHGKENGRNFFDIDITAVAREKRAIRAGGRGADVLAAVLRSDPRIQAALSPDTAALGGNLIPTDFVRQLYDYLEVFTGMRRANVTVLTTESGNALEFPRVATGGTAVLVGAGTAIGGSDPTFGKMTLNAWKYGEIVRVPVELLEDSGVDLPGFLAKDFGRAIGRASNAGYTTGTGSNQPEGLMAVIGTAVTGANGGTGIFSYDDLIDLEYSVNSEYAMGAQWMMKRATIGRARKLKDNDGQYLWQAARLPGEPDTLDGYEVVENPAMAAVGTGLLSVAFGDMSTFYIRDVGSIRVTRSDDRYFDTDEVGWKATLRTDSGLIDLTGAVKAYRGGTA